MLPLVTEPPLLCLSPASSAVAEGLSPAPLPPPSLAPSHGARW